MHVKIRFGSIVRFLFCFSVNAVYNYFHITVRYRFIRDYDISMWNAKKATWYTIFMCVFLEYDISFVVIYMHWIFCKSVKSGYWGMVGGNRMAYKRLFM